MITHASTTLPWRRSFSVHVEMYSRGSNSRGRRSSFTTSWSRMARRRTGRCGKTFAGSPAVAGRGQAPDRPDPDEDESKEAKAEREIPCDGKPGLIRQHAGHVHQDLVQGEQHHPQ